MVKNLDGEEVELPPKDEEELLLEKLVFGDIEGFEKNLKKLDNLYDYSSDEEDRGSDKFFDNSSEESSDDENDSNVQDEDLFFIDNEGDQKDDRMDIDGEESEDGSEDEEDEEDAAWEDSDDEKINFSLLSSDKLKKLRKSPTDSNISGKSYIIRLRSQFEKIYPRPEWIDKIEEEGEAGSDDENNEQSAVRNNDTNAVLNILNTSQKFILNKHMKLISPNRISITRLKDANHQKTSRSAIQSVQFHHSHPLLLTGGFDKTIRIYHIDGKTNTFITSLHLRDSPISSVEFSPVGKDKNLIYAAGRRKYMNKWDLNTGEVEKVSRMYGHEHTQRSFESFKVSPKGTYIGLIGSGGWCNILNGLTGQWIRGFKIEGTVVDFVFGHDESYVIIINTAGEVWEYELGAEAPKADVKEEEYGFGRRKNLDPPKVLNKIIRRWQDDGGVGITKIALGGPNDRWLAIGTNNGWVNIYDRTSPSQKPFATIDNLVTSISSLKFNPDGQVLCIASRAKRDALRLVHLPSGSVYSNWPTSGTPLGRVTAVNFSPNNEMLAVGNEAGKVTLWRLDHY